MGLKRTLTFLLTLICLAGSSAIETRSTRIQGTSVAAGHQVSVRDDKFPVPYTAGWDAGFAYMYNRGIVEFGLDETKRVYYGNDFKVTLVVNITATDKHNNTQTFSNQSVSITYKRQGSYTDKAQLVLDGFTVLDVSIVSVSAIDLSTNASTTVPGELFVEARMATTRYYNFSPLQSPVTSAPHLNYNVLSICSSAICTQPSCLVAADPTEIEVYWDYMPGAEEYELEWTWVNDYAGSTGEYNFKFDATRVSTSNTWYRIPLVYESGFIVYRLRAIGRGGSDFSQRIEGAWTNLPESGLVANYPANMKYELAPHSSDAINWASTLTFDENGRKGAGISYMDGMLMGRQSMARLNTENKMIAQSVIYDYQGRPAISVLPAPYNQNCFNYITNLNRDANGNIYDKPNFDDDVSCTTPTDPMSTTLSGGAANYYSASNSSQGSQQGYLPDAKARPFVQVEYTPDMTGRIKSQTIPGDAHQLGSGKETKFYYTNPGSEELIQLFGSEVGNVSHYDKNIVKDANGQLSASYIDMKGRVIATSLLGASPAAVEQVQGYNDVVSLHDDMSQYNKTDKNNYTITSTKSIFVETPNTTQNITYNFMPQDFSPDCTPNFCFDCFYEVEIKITDACNANVIAPITATVGNIFVADATCENPSVAYAISPNPTTVTFPNIGEYFITKTLKVSDINLDAYLNLYLKFNTCIPSYQSILNQQLSNIDFSSCNTDCQSCLASVSTYTNSHSLSQDQVNKLLAECDNLCAPIDPCEGYRQEMLHDFYPGGQYAGYNVSGNVYTSSTDQASIFNDVNNVYGISWKTNTLNYQEADGSTAMVTLVRNNVQVTLHPYDLTLQEYVTYFKPSWAQAFLNYHPEKCYLDFCNANKASDQYDYGMMQVNTFDDAYQKGYLKPLSSISLPSGMCGTGTAGSPNLDPFFNTSGIGSTSGLNTSLNGAGANSFTDEWGNTISAAISYTGLMNLAFSNAFPAKGPHTTLTSSMPLIPLAVNLARGGSNLSTAFGCDPCTKDQEWIMFRNLYLNLKMRLVAQAKTDYVVHNGCFNGCMQNSGLNPFSATNPNPTSLNFTPYIFPVATGYTSANPFFSLSAYPLHQQPYALVTPNYSGQAFLYDGYNANQPMINNGYYPTCSAQAGSVFTSKQAHFTQTPFDFTSLSNYYNNLTPPTSSNPSPLPASPSGPPYNTSANTANYCQNTCQSYADGWIRKLSNCGSLDQTNATLVQNIKSGLVEVCMKGCDTQNPYGASTASVTIAGNGPGNFDSFGEVLAYYNVDQTDPACNSLNLDFPEPYNHDYSGAGTGTSLLDTCGCNKILNAQTSFAQLQNAGNLPAGVTTVEQLFEYYYGIGLPNFSDLSCKCTAALSGSTWTPAYQWGRDQQGTLYAYNVPVAPAMSCQPCVPCSTIVAAVSSFTTAHSNWAHSDQYSTLLENQLNSSLNMNLTYSDYMDFVAACGSQTVSSTSTSATQLASFLDAYVAYMNAHSLNVCGNTLTPANFPTLFTAALDPFYPNNSLASIHCIPSANSNPGNLDNISFYFPQYSDVGTTCTLRLDAIGGLTGYTNFHVTNVSFNVPASQSASFNFIATATYVDASGVTQTFMFYGYYSCLNLKGPMQQNPLRLCNQPYTTPVPVYNDCVQNMIDQATNNASLIYQSYVSQYTAAFIKNYKEHCINVQETYARDYSLREYHYTLYYYDQAGNLVRTVSPKGVKKLSATQITQVEGGSDVFAAHTYVTNYGYQSYGAPNASKTPDETGNTQYYYDNIGRIKLSCNAEQIANGQYSYTLYDALGRITTVGVLGNLPAYATKVYLVNLIQTNAFDAFILSPPSSTITHSQVIKTYYDAPLNNTVASQFGGNPIAGYGQTNLRNRVATVTYEELDDYNDNTYTYATHYAYDQHGNVGTLVQDLPELQQLAERYVKIVYAYDLISGNVNQVTYQPGLADQLMHKYEYDADNRLHNVYTSKDGVNWDRDAKYFYYQHGPLARTELGDQQVQGTDYAYTIHGWVKAVNSNILNEYTDMGKDGGKGNVYAANYSNLHQYVAKDAAGYNLNYYQQGSVVDYTAIKTFAGATNRNPIADNSTNASWLSTNAPDLFNGNISSMVTSIYDIDPDPTNTHTQGTAFPQFTAYKYDQLHRIMHMNAYRDINLATNTWNTAGSDQSYKTDFTYDMNGNILSHKRNGASFIGAGLNMDDLTYIMDDASATAPTNKLVGVNDAISGAGYTTDIQGASSAVSGTPSSYDYNYDHIGNLQQDNKEFIQTITWTVDRKVRQVIRNGSAMVAAGKNLPDLEFTYDANRQRVCKITKPHDSSGNLKDQGSWQYTYYVRDASGNITATYTRAYTPVAGQANTYTDGLGLQEHDLYGSARLGVYNENLAMSSKTFTATLSGGQFQNIGFPTGPVQPVVPCLVQYTDGATGDLLTAACPATYTRTLGNKRYELTNHLGNVIAVISDRKLQSAGPSSTTVYERIFDDNDLTGVYLDPNIPATGGIVNNALQVNPQGAYSGVNFNFPTNPGQAYQVEFDLDQGTVDASDNLQLWIYDGNFNSINTYPLGAVQSGHYTFSFTGYAGATDMWVKPMFISGQNTPANTGTPHFNHYFSIDNFRVTTQNCRKCQDIKTVYDNFVSANGSLSNANMSSFTTYANSQLGLSKSQADYTQVLTSCKLMMNVLNFNGTSTEVVSNAPANFNLGNGDVTAEGNNINSSNKINSFEKKIQMNTIKIVFSVTLLVILIFVIVFIINKTEQTKQKGKDFYLNFNVKVSGIVIRKEEMGHGYAKITLEIIESNTATYHDTINKEYPYCDIDGDIATFIGSFNTKVFINDSVRMGPNDSITVYRRSRM